MSAKVRAAWWKRLLTWPFLLVAAVVVLVEDWLWDDLQRLAAALGRLPILRRLEAWIGRLPPYGALCLFAVPSLFLVPVKLIALYLLSHGQATTGIVVVVSAKVAGTALVARVFSLTKPKLLTLGWFAWLYGKVVAFKARLYGAIHATPVYRAAHAFSVRLRGRLRTWFAGRPGFLRRRYEVAKRWVRARKR